MTKHFKRLLPFLCSLLLGGSVHAQFYPTGSTPASVRWYRMQTADFDLLFPEGCDSLARVYGSVLARYREDVGRSCGISIGQGYRSRMPVVLHAFTGTANGAVAWAPRRMDLYTMPDPFAPTPLPWPDLLAIHEGRHVAQMSFGALGCWLPLHRLVGEMLPGALAGVYPGPVLLEGDAVVAETALSASGRGRQAAFLDYFAPAVLCGDLRDYYRWVYGAQAEYAPDYYRAGFLLVSGMRAFHDDPLFTARYFDRVTRRPGLGLLPKTVREASGMKLNPTFRDILARYGRNWEEAALARGPFTQAAPFSPQTRLHTEYSGFSLAPDGGLFSVKSGLATASVLVKVHPDGREETLRPFASSAGRLHPDPVSGRIYWTETVPDPRWTLRQYSVVRYIDPGTSRRIHTLGTGDARRSRYFGGVPAEDGRTLLVVAYPATGGSCLRVLDAADGSVQTSWTAPDSLQLTEPACTGGRFFAVGLSKAGCGLYEALPEGGWRCLLAPRPATIHHLDGKEGKLFFVSDRTGAGEYYVLDPGTGSVQQLTATRFGLREAVTAPDGSLFWSGVAASDTPASYRMGTRIYVSGTLRPRTVSYDSLCRYPVADLLSAQEARLAGKTPEKERPGTVFSPVRRYPRLHPPRIHSWAPVFFNYDNIEDLSEDVYYKTASAGATVYFQNLTGDGYGFAGYSFHPDPVEKGKWRHSAHLKYIWTGWFPVLEGSLDYGDQARADILRILLTDENGNTALGTTRTYAKAPYLYGEMKAYVPLVFSSGGWRRGLVPQVRYGFSNNRYDDDISVQTAVADETGEIHREEERRIDVGGQSFMQNLTASVRGYATLSTPSGRIFPRWGIGAETGFHLRPGHAAAFTPAVYGYAYAYAPGLLDTHGFRMTATLQRQLHVRGWCFGENAVQTHPRGMAGSTLPDLLGRLGERQARLTVDYAMPVRWPLRSSLLSPLVYVKRIEAVPFADLSYTRFRRDLLGVSNIPLDDAFFASAGADLVLRLANLLWLPYDASAGIRIGRNFCPAYFSQHVALLQRPFFATFLFSMDL